MFGKRLVALILLLLIAGFKSDRKATLYTFPSLQYFPKMPVNEANPVTIEGAELGRYLFYDPILSRDSNLSCASCHKQAYAFCDAPNTFSKGFNNALQTRNTLPLFNLAWHPSFFWDGRAGSIESQVFHPIRSGTEMNMDWSTIQHRLMNSKTYPSMFRAAFGNQTIDSILVSKAIAQFERTLLSYNSKYDKVLHGETNFTKDEADGFEIMNEMTRGDCLHCHTTDSDPMGSTFEFSNNGLDTATTANSYRDAGRGAITNKSYDNGKFKIPSLRNVAVTAPYMHDGRFKTLEEVIDFYSVGVHAGINTDSKMEQAHIGGVHLTEKDKRKVIAFLNTLTDSEFISNPAFSNPFVRK